MTDFADDTNFRYESPSLTDSNRKLNYDMSRVTHWVRAKKKKKILECNENGNDYISFG